MAATMSTGASPATVPRGLPADPIRAGAQKQFEMEALTHSLQLLGRLEDKDIHRVHGLPVHHSHEGHPDAAAAAGLPRSQANSSGHGHGEVPSLAASRTSSSSSQQSQGEGSGDDIQVLSPAQEVPMPMPSSPAQKQKHVEADEMLLPRLCKDDVEYASVNVCDDSPKLRDVRSLLVKQYPFLVSPPEAKPKARKPNAPPPALLPKPRIVSDDEKAARQKSLVVRLEDVEYRNDVKGLVVVESRRSEWRNIADAHEAAEAHPLPVNLPSPWLLDIDGAALLAKSKSQKAKKTFALPSHRYISSCVDCRGAGTTQCTGCQGIESDECFWCEGTGFRRRGKRCDVCEGKTTYQCTHCKNEGVVKCKSCSGHGKALVGLFVTVKMRCIELPPIRLEKLVGQDGLADEAAIRAVAVDKVLQAVLKLRGDATVGSSKAPFVPVMARCLVERSVSRTFSVLRPLHENWKDAAKAFDDATPADATGLEAMVTEGASYPSPFAALSRGNSNLFAFEGMDPKTQVESRRYKLSSAPGSVPKDVTPAGASAAPSTRTSSSASRAVSRDVSPSSTPAGFASLSPRTSVANLQTLFKQVERQKSFLSLPGSPPAAGARTPATPGSPIDGSGSGSNGMGLLDENTAHFMAALQRQQRLYSMPGQGSAPMFGSAAGGGSFSSGSVKKRASISQLFTRSQSNSGPSSPVYSPGFQFGFTPATAGSGSGGGGAVPKSRSGSSSTGFSRSRRNRQSATNLAQQAQGPHPAVMPQHAQTVPNTPMRWNNEDPFRNVQIVGAAK